MSSPAAPRRVPANPLPVVYLPLPGEPISPDDLHVRRSRDVARVVQQGHAAYARLVECRHWGEDPRIEAIILDVEVELPQRPVADLRRFERLAMVFSEDHALMPDVLALRADFPEGLHLIPRPAGAPKCLCLYDEPWPDLKLGWTASGYIERARTWLALTARGELHAPDQPVEPLLAPSPYTLVLPEQVVDGGSDDAPEALTIRRVDGPGDRSTLIATASEEAPLRPGENGYLATVIRTAAQEQRMLRALPTTLLELDDVLRTAGADLLGLLRGRFLGWTGAPNSLDRVLVIVVLVPVTRRPGEQPEGVDARAYLCTRETELASIRDVGVALGWWDRLPNGSYGQVLGDISGTGVAEIALLPVNPVTTFTRGMAARSNGVQGPLEMPVVAIGMGALGSQVFGNLIRTGWGRWTVIDRDVFLPHNLARHHLPGDAVGMAKAIAVAALANEMIDGPEVARAIAADILSPVKDTKSVADALQQADLVLDMSASVAVARHLARAPATAARRVSLFLNPSGTDLVFLAEDAERKLTLDGLEMQYYRALIEDPSLAGHLRDPGGYVRYGRTCRDLSAEIPQHRVALHAAIGSNALQTTTARAAARIALWRVDPELLTVACVEVVPAETCEWTVGEWTLWTDRRVLDTLAGLRAERLPNETGGVLIGTFDLERRIAYVVDVVPSPPDSVEWPTSYIRGRYGLRQRVQEIETLTGGMLTYAGEWHAHPAGHGPWPSDDDCRAFAWQAELRAANGLPPLMVIVGDSETYGWYVGVAPRVVEQ